MVPPRKFPPPRASHRNRRHSWGFAVLLAAALSAAGFMPEKLEAHSYKLGHILIGHIWGPVPEPGSKAMPVYGPILNRGDRTVRLVGASTPVADRARFRIRKAGRDRWLTAIALPPGKPVGLASWRQHIWLTGLRRKLKEGNVFKLTLDFGDAGKKTIEVIVEKSPGH